MAQQDSNIRLSLTIVLPTLGDDTSMHDVREVAKGKIEMHHYTTQLPVTG